jgi:outer membrane protein TolC
MKNNPINPNNPLDRTPSLCACVVGALAPYNHGLPLAGTRGGLRWGWVTKDAQTHPHPSLPPEGEGINSSNELSGIKLTFCICLSFLLAVSNVQAEPIAQDKLGFSRAASAQAMPISGFTLAELSDFALHNNPTTRESWTAARSQFAALGVLEAANYPTLNANLALSRGMSSINTSTGVVSGNTQTRFSPSLSLSYMLFDFGATRASIQSAQAALLAANLTQDRTAQAVVFGVEQAYYQLLAARQAELAAEEGLKTAQLSLTVVNERRLAGLATIGDVYLAETALAQSRLQWRKAQGEANKSVGVLCNAVGIPVQSKLALASAESALPTQEVRQSITEYLEKAKRLRPDLGAAEAQIRAAKLSADAIASQDKPSLQLAISGGKTYNNFPDNGLNNGSSNASIGLNLNIPLFDGNRAHFSGLQAQARAEQLESTQQRLINQVELEVWQAYFDLETAESTIENARALLKSAGLAREVAQARYQAGVGNLPVLLTAQTNEASARLEVIQAEMSWYANLSRLNNAMGSFSNAGTR